MYKPVNQIKLALRFIACLLAIQNAGADAQVLDSDLRVEALLNHIELETLADDLDLSPEQKFHVGSILERFADWQSEQEQEFRRQEAEIRDRQIRIQQEIAEANGRPEPSVDEAWVQSKEDWAALRLGAFETSVEIVERQNTAVGEICQLLTQEQAAKFNALVRDVRRERTVAWGAKFPEERVDLVEVFLNTDAVAGDEIEMLRPTLARYAQDMDVLLQARNALLRDEPVASEQDLAPTPIEQAFNDGRISRQEVEARRAESEAQRVERRIARLRPIMASHQAVADLNRAWYDQCFRLLSPASQAAVQRAYWRQAYATDRVEARLRTDALLEDALALDSLTPTQRAALETIRKVEWLEPRRAIEARLRRNADERSRAWEDAVSVKKHQNPWEIERSSLWKEVDSLGATVAKRVSEALTSEQREQLSLP